MKYIKIIATLTLVAVLSAAVLAIADRVSRVRIAENEKRAINDAIGIVAADGERIVEEDGLYKIYGADQEIIAYAFLAQGQGYQGHIKIICGISAEGDKLLGIEIVESKETPGLGAKINGSWFKDQFKGMSVVNPLNATKSKPTDSGEIQTITGATVSSKAVVNIVNGKVKEVQKLIK